MRMNRVVLMGHLGDDVVSSMNKNGRKVASFKISTNEFYKTDDGEKKKRTDWHKILVSGKSAEACEKMLRKGSFVLVEGKIRNEQEDGCSYVIVASDVSFISNYGGSNNGE